MRLLSSFLACLLLLLALPRAGRAQEGRAPAARNAAYVELAGNALLYSLNYERRLGGALTGRVGLMAYGDTEGDAGLGALLVPVMAGYLVGPGPHHLEVGAGVLLAALGLAIDDAGGVGTGVALTATLGYRYQRPAGGLVLRAGLTPVVSTEAGLLWAGASIGYAF